MHPLGIHAGRLTGRNRGSAYIIFMERSMNAFSSAPLSIC
ncbi:hypothetical protein GGR28_001509 [Lewinella aquimaris]|uniref:Uncharacterized protein n=1 Tax=Neolewinella aquimaris TaxID=1835722 RepID=A0A840E589_9BACT|nr:hypothetical protein [Neolewinella aquimaris]